MFEHLADIPSHQEWGGMSVSVEPFTAGPTGTGSAFRVTGHLADRSTSGVFQVITYDPPSRMVVEGKGVGIDSVSEYRLTPIEGGTRLTRTLRLTGSVDMDERIRRSHPDRLLQMSLQRFKARVEGTAMPTPTSTVLGELPLGTRLLLRLLLRFRRKHRG